jgi:hypothetical protein
MINYSENDGGSDMAVRRFSLYGMTMVALLSCTSGLQIAKSSLSEIHRGMSQKECRAALFAEPKLQFTVNHDEAAYPIEVYDMQTGIISSPTASYIPSQWGGIIVPGTTYSGVYSDYVFVYNEKGLIYWGFMDDLHETEDKLIQELSPLIFLEKERALKKPSGAQPPSQDTKQLTPSKHSDEIDDQVGRS